MVGEYVSLFNTRKRKCMLLLIFCIGVVYSMMLTGKIGTPWKTTVYEVKDSDEDTSPTMSSTTSSSTTTTTTRLTTTILWFNQAEKMLYVTDKPLRCKAEFLGCFLPILGKGMSKTLKVNVSKESGPLKEKCLNACYKRGNHLAAFNGKSGSCVCSKEFEGFISVMKGGPLPEAAWDRSNNCKSPLSLRVYNVLRNCETGVSTSSMEKDRVGCIIIPKSLNGMMVALEHPKTTSEQCILNCEQRGFTYAVAIKDKSRCLCSDSLSLFSTADNMQRMLDRCESKESDRVPVFRTTVDDDNCTPIRFLDKNQAPSVLLASYYGSGNTWIRHLIEVSTGYYTGSVYRDKKLYEGGMLGELQAVQSGRTIAVKDHLFKLKILPIFQSAILLLRNPYDATLAEWSRRKTKSHTGVVDPHTFQSQDFKKYAGHRPKYWFSIADTVLKSLKKVLVVYYEDLKVNASKEMRRIVEFLPKNIVPSGDDFERRLMCMNLDLVGQFKRPPRKLDFDPFDAYIRNDFDERIRDLDDLLIEYHHPPLPDSYFLPY